MGHRQLGHHVDGHSTTKIYIIYLTEWRLRCDMAGSLNKIAQDISKCNNLLKGREISIFIFGDDRGHQHIYTC